MERSDLQDLVEKLEAAVRNLEGDKKKLHEDLKHVSTDINFEFNRNSILFLLA